MNSINNFRFITILSLLSSLCIRTIESIKSFSVSQILELHNDNRFISKSISKSTSIGGSYDDDGNDATSHVKELYLEQRLDHFESHHSKHYHELVFSQRYFYSTANIIFPFEEDEYKDVMDSTASVKSKKRSTFAFLCVGGEGPSLTKHVLVDSVHCTGDMVELAAKLNKYYDANIHLFALEHRYYGNSYPQFSDESSSISNENLKYLSSRQAISDIAAFVEYAKIHHGLNDDVKWITFGGSYPGMLAAWSRLKFPHLIYAAVSNSAPVQVVLDFHEYKSVVAYALKDEMIGGSNECHDIIHQGHNDIASILANNTMESREMIANMFNLCGGAESLAEKKNINSFLGDGVIYIPAQENDPSCDEDFCNIEKICDFITTSSSLSPIEKLGKISVAQTNRCKDIDWEKMISYLSSDAAIEEGNRSWLWQTCTEMGFYQTCELNSSCPFGRGYHQLDADLEICERAFGIDRQLVPYNVQETLTYYGGWDMEGSRILSVNGDVDPWSAQSMNIGGKVNSTDLPTYWSVNASHHFWTHEVKQSDGEGIFQTREMIHDWVIGLLFHSGDENDNVVDDITSIY